ncbi:MAG: tetratricopeptide repeat protein [Planctomycetota bacterium]
MVNDHCEDQRGVADVQRELIAVARQQARGMRGVGESDVGAGSDSGFPPEDSSRGSEAGPPTFDSFAGYQIVKELHRGGQGIVYQAIQLSTRRNVAVKVMKEGVFAGVTEKARFDREVQTLGQLNHPNIVAIHGTGLAAGCHYFVMDYIPGQPLDRYVAGGSRNVSNLLGLFVKICNAMTAAHLRGIIHRDLKPSNIRVDDTGEPHILDFGLARSSPTESDASFMTVTGQFVGSLPWASPEQAEGVPGKLDVRTDVYSIGVMLYQILTGRFPYDVYGNMREVLDRIMHADPVRPSAIRRDVDDEVETIVLKCLEKEPDRRYQNAGELARDLRHYLSGEPIEAKRDSTIYVLRKRLRKHLVPVTIAFAFLVTVIVGLIATAAGWRQAASERDTAEAARAQAQAVTDFLMGTLGSANPYGGRGPNTTIGEILEGAAQQVETSFKEQPLVQAAVYDSLAGTYDALGLFSVGYDCAQKALELRRRWLPADHPDVAASLCLQAQMATKLAQHAQAEEWARESLSLRQRHFGLRHPAVVESLNALGIAIAAQGRYNDAEPVWREAVAQTEEFFGTKHGASINPTFRLASCLYEQARLDEAGPLFEQVVVLGREVLGPEHPEVANMLSSFGEVLHLKGDFEAAASAYRESLAIRRKVFGDEHITIANSLNNLAFLLADEERFEEAEPLYEESLDMRRRLYGPRRIEVTFALNGLARLYNRTGRPAEAEAMLRESLSIFDETLPQHWRRAYAQCLLGAALSNQRRFEEAEPLLLNGLKVVRAARGHGDRYTQEVLRYVVEFHEAMGRTAEGEAYSRLVNER